LILRKIIKIFATRFQILRLKCTKSDFGWGSASDPAGELTAPPELLSGLKGIASKGRGGRGNGREEGREGMGKEGRGDEGEGNLPYTTFMTLRRR